MISGMVKTFLELGDATSRNLEFSHRKNVYVSYGEETITETNLLEIRRRHPRRIFLSTFPKAKEAQNGADFDWHIIGNKWTLKMRVQAKRAQRDGRLNIKHRVRTSGKQQRELLLCSAECENVKPLYCIYCTECQRSFWNQRHPESGLKGYENGCLLADANDVPEATKGLCKIERKCIPWHYLFERADFAHSESGGLYSGRGGRKADDGGANDIAGVSPWQAPTVADLNGEGHGNFDRDGVHETDGERLYESSSLQVGLAKTLKSGIHRLLVIDVRDRE